MIKNFILSLIAVLSTTLIFAQTNFQWEKIDSVQKSKAQIYSDTKMFIADYWKSANTVIQNDDKDGGMILVKAVNIQHLDYQMNDHIWTYSYTVKFFMKDGKYRVIIENVFCQSARCGNFDWPLMPVSDSYPVERGLRETGLNNERYTEVMLSLKVELQNIINSYEKSIKTPSVSSGDW